MFPLYSISLELYSQKSYFIVLKLQSVITNLFVSAELMQHLLDIEF